VIWIGIDPGLQGAVCRIIEKNDGAILCLDWYDTPTRKAARGHEFADGEMALLLRRLVPPRSLPDQCFATIEQVSIRPGESGTSALKIGKGWGVWKGLLAGLGIPHEVVLPTIWKNHFGLGGCDKKASRARAIELFPSKTEELAKRRCDVSEAILLCEYGRRRQKGAK
jgi:crossover junction endodeoxyribonuclease RuvC